MLNKNKIFLDCINYSLGLFCIHNLMNIVCAFFCIMPMVSLYDIRKFFGGYLNRLELDSRSIGLFRIMLGVSFLYNFLFFKLTFIKEWFGADRIIPKEVMSRLNGAYSFSLFNYIYNDNFAVFCLVVGVVCAVLYTIGFYPKVTGLLLLLVNFNFINSYDRYVGGYEKYSDLFLFWSLFLPLNVFSVQKNKKYYLPNKLIVFLLLLQIGLIYFSTGMAKYGSSWSGGFAVKIMASDFWMTTPLANFFQNSFVYKPLTYLTLVFDYLLVFILLFPISKNNKTRYLAFLFLFLFHLSILCIYDVINFSISGIAVALLLLPSHFWSKIKVLQNISFEKPNPSGRLYNTFMVFSLYIILIKATLFILEFSWLKNYTIAKRADVILKKIDIPLASPNSIYGQYWKMFAPDPIKDVGWLTIEYIGDDGLLYDFFSNQIVDENDKKCSYFPVGIEKQALGYARAIHFQNKWYTRVFLKYWYYSKLKNIPKEKWKNYFVAEYRYTLDPENEKYVPVITKTLLSKEAFDAIQLKKEYRAPLWY